MGFRVWCSKALIKEGRDVNGALMCQITSQRAVHRGEERSFSPHESIVERTVKETVISTVVKCEVYVTAV